MASKKSSEMAHVKCEDIVIPIFDGSDYQNWKRRILKLLEYKKCKEVATRRKLNTDKDDEWNEAELKAVNYIYSAITNKQLEYLGDEASAYQIFKKFDSMYSKESTALQIVRRNGLETIKLSSFQNVTSFFDQFEKAVNELKAAGAEVTEQEKLRYLLRALPRSYSYIGDLIGVLPEEERTVEYLKSKITLKAAEEQEYQETNDEQCDRSMNKSNAFVSEMRGKCFQCGKTGHYKKDYVQFNNARQYGRNGQYRGWSCDRGGPRRGFRGGRGRGDSRGAAFAVGTFVTQVNASEINRNEEVSQNKITWLLDSGCTDHIINNENLFSDYEILKIPVDVKLGDGKILKATKRGTVHVKFKVYSGSSNVCLPNVYFVKDMLQNLMSYSKITTNNKIVSSGNITKMYNPYNQLIATAYKQDNLFVMTGSIDNRRKYGSSNSNAVNYARNVDGMSVKEKWHRMLGHINFNYLNTLCKNELLKDLPLDIEQDYMKCEICIRSKMHNVPFANDRKRASQILELIHTDVNGPHKTAGYKGEKYFVLFVDDFSKIAQVHCIKSKHEVYGCLVDYVNAVENATDKKVKAIRCDNGKEYLNRDVFRFASERGIRIVPCPPYVHQLNGVAERYNRTIMDMARCLFAEAQVHRRYWPEVIKTVAYLKNRSIANTLIKKTPYEIFFKQKPSVKHLKLYGSKVFVKTPEQLRFSKWDDKAKMGILLGYNETSYRVLMNGKVINARHVDIVEDDITCIAFRLDENVNSNVKDDSKEKADSCSDEYFDLETEEQTTEPIVKDNVKQTNELKCKQSSEQEKGLELRRSTRQKKTSTTYPNSNYKNYVYVNCTNVLVPNSYEEAIQSDESDQWREAMNREMQSLIGNETWTVVDRPENEKIVELK